MFSFFSSTGRKTPVGALQQGRTDLGFGAYFFMSTPDADGCPFRLYVYQLPSRYQRALWCNGLVLRGPSSRASGATRWAIRFEATRTRSDLGQGSVPISWSILSRTNKLGIYRIPHSLRYRANPEARDANPEARDACFTPSLGPGLYLGPESGPRLGGPLCGRYGLI